MPYYSMFGDWKISRFSGNIEVDSTTFHNANDEFEYIRLSILYSSQKISFVFQTGQYNFIKILID